MYKRQGEAGGGTRRASVARVQDDELEATWSGSAVPAGGHAGQLASSTNSTDAAPACARGTPGQRPPHSPDVPPAAGFTRRDAAAAAQSQYAA